MLQNFNAKCTLTFIRFTAATMNSGHILIRRTQAQHFQVQCWVMGSLCEMIKTFSLVPRPSLLVCVQYNTQKWKSGQKQGRPWNTYHMNNVRWMRGGRWGRGPHSYNITTLLSILSLSRTPDVHKIASTPFGR